MPDQDDTHDLLGRRFPTEPEPDAFDWLDRLPGGFPLALCAIVGVGLWSAVVYLAGKLL